MSRVSCGRHSNHCDERKCESNQRCKLNELGRPFKLGNLRLLFFFGHSFCGVLNDA